MRRDIEAGRPAPRPRRRGRCMRFFHGYLMTAGAISTLYGLLRLIVWLFVELNRM